MAGLTAREFQCDICRIWNTAFGTAWHTTPMREPDLVSLSRVGRILRAPSSEQTAAALCHMIS
ncbi:hypothetical protein BRAS3843_980020 [Bradyrhizobium sp. STM 3843]|nr:hypothetical protein BRAS3843_980020 [Bradyrhizobium sp. STM 3843]